MTSVDAALDPGPAWGRPARLVALAVVGTVAVVRFSTAGVPLDLAQIYAWIGAFLVAGCVGRSRRWIVQTLTTWVPYVALIVIYQLGYGEAGRFVKTTDFPEQGDVNVIGVPLHVQWPVRVDQAMFGGTLPTVWLQEHLHAGGTPWFAWVTTLTYCSHFVFAPLAALVLWWRGSTLFRPWVMSVLALAAAGLTLYFLFPMAPPWLAAQQGSIDAPVDRLIGEGWSQLHFSVAQQLVETGDAMSNPVAAMPSLHMATAVLAAVMLPWYAPRWVRVLALAYPATMAFTLLYGGEHYVIDEVVGTAISLTIVAVWRRLVRRGDRVLR